MKRGEGFSTNSSNCVDKIFECASGKVVVIVCDSTKTLLENTLVKREKFTSIAVGMLSSAFEDDWSKSYFMFIKDNTGGGFYIEADTDALDDSSCGSLVIPYVINNIGVLNLPEETKNFLYVILTRKIFNII